MPVQKTYYSLKDSKPICHKCISDLTDRADIIEMIEAQKELFSVVLPTCLSKDCGKFTTERQKRPKRPAPGARPPAKRRRGGDDAAPE